MLQIVRHNFGLKALALALAILGWAYFRFNDNPLAGQDQQLSVPITAINVPPGYETKFAEKEAVVTVVPQRGMPAPKPGEIKAVLDLSKVPPPITAQSAVSVPVTPVAGPNTVVQSLSPPTVALTIDRIVTRPFAVSVHYQESGEARVVVSALALSPWSASVRGGWSDVSKVAALRVNLPLPWSAGPIDEMVRPVPVDSQGREIAGLTVAPNLVRVRVRLARAAGAKR